MKTRSFFIPKGIAQRFVSLSEQVLMHYKTIQFMYPVLILVFGGIVLVLDGMWTDLLSLREIMSI